MPRPSTPYYYRGHWCCTINYKAVRLCLTPGCKRCEPDGNVRKKHLGENYRKADARLQEIKRAAAAASQVSPETILRDVIAAYRLDKPSADRQSRLVLLDQLYGSVPIGSLTGLQAAEWSKRLDLKPISFNSYVLQARALWTYARGLYVAKDADCPFDKITLFAKGEARDHRTRTATDAEFAALLRHATPDERRKMRFVRFAPVRLQDLLARWAWWNGGKRITVPAKEHKGGKKTGKDRTICLPAKLVRMLRAMRKCRPNDERLWQRGISNKRFRNMCKAAGITPADKHESGEPLVFYSLRHTWTTRSAERMPLAVVSKLLGHSSVAQTMKYVHIDMTDCERWMESAG